MKRPGFIDDLRLFLIPERKWHYVFHVMVLVVSVSYWVGSMMRLPDASLAEISMYRLEDNEYWVPISAVSKFNFGDPTDAVFYGQRLMNWPLALLVPQALGATLFGHAGYIVAEAVLWWCYFLAITLLLRRCNFGNFSSLLVGSAITVSVFYALGPQTMGTALTRVLAVFGLPLTDFGFPPLAYIGLGSKRMPRPLVTEIFEILLLYFLVRIWQNRRLPSLKTGMATGALLALLLQGDTFSASAMGLLVAGTMAWVVFPNRWQLPWRFALGAGIGGMVFGWFFLLQRLHETPDALAHFGVGKHSRLDLVFLPGYAPLLRVGVICVLSWMVLRALRHYKLAGPVAVAAGRKSEEMPASRGHKPAEQCLGREYDPKAAPIEQTLAYFAVAVVLAGWLAQPAQVFLLGKVAQIYHYLINTLPQMYSYALLILSFTFLRLVLPVGIRDWVAELGRQPKWTGANLLGVLLSLETIAGMGVQLETIDNSKTARREGHIPWAAFGDNYRPNFRALEKEFRENPSLAQTRTFGTLCYEVNFLLAGFYDKRAFLPDNTFTTLRDAEIEERVCEMGKILGLNPEQFGQFIQQHYIMNYWLGAGKYWFATDYKFGADEDYAPETIEALKRMTKESPWVLIMPRSELARLVKKYQSVLAAQSDERLYPDVIILTAIEKNMGLVPKPGLYKEAYSNQVFTVYKKTS